MTALSEIKALLVVEMLVTGHRLKGVDAALLSVRNVTNDICHQT